MDELRRMKPSDVVAVPEGYNVTFSHAKQQQHKKEHTFLIPRNKEGPVCFASVIRAYFEALNKDLPDRKQDILFFTGQKQKKSGVSRFLDQPIGVNTISDTGKAIAKILGLDSPDRYTGHCFRYLLAAVFVIIVKFK